MSVDLHNWETIWQLTKAEAERGNIEWVSTTDHEFTPLMHVQYKRSRMRSPGRRRGNFENALCPAEREFLRVQAERLVRNHVRPCV